MTNNIIIAMSDSHCYLSSKDGRFADLSVDRNVVTREVYEH